MAITTVIELKLAPIHILIGLLRSQLNSLPNYLLPPTVCDADYLRVPSNPGLVNQSLAPNEHPITMSADSVPSGRVAQDHGGSTGARYPKIPALLHCYVSVAR
jgi:hypothetical protein